MDNRKYTNEDFNNARSVSIMEYLNGAGYNLEPHGRGNFHIKDGSHDSLVIYPQTNSWFSFKEGNGGNIIDFLRRVENKSMDETMESLLKGQYSKSYVPSESEKKELKLPQKNPTMKRTFAYLTQSRGIDPGIVSHFAHEHNLYESSDHHNAVFLGRDKEGTIRYAHERGTNSYLPYRQDAPGSDKSYAFGHMGKSGTLFAFEAPIDLMSFMSLYSSQSDLWNHSYISLGGVSGKALFQTLKDHPGISNVKLCLDNDAAGQSAADTLTFQLQRQGIWTERLIPETKDWNDDLKNTSQESNLVSAIKR